VKWPQRGVGKRGQEARGREGEEWADQLKFPFGFYISIYHEASGQEYTQRTDEVVARLLASTTRHLLKQMGRVLHHVREEGRSQHGGRDPAPVGNFCKRRREQVLDEHRQGGGKRGGGGRGGGRGGGGRGVLGPIVDDLHADGNKNKKGIRKRDRRGGGGGGGFPVAVCEEDHGRQDEVHQSGGALAGGNERRKGRRVENREEERPQ
jgi:hypothetical protein